MEKYLCHSCQRRMPKPIGEPNCKKCGKPLLREEQEYCYDCNRQEPSFTRAKGLFLYEDPLKESLMGLKFRERKEYGIFLGSGVVFAPVPRDYSFKMNKKERRIALKSALTTRVQENKLVVLDELKLDAIKTKDMQNVLNNLKVEKAMVVTDNENVIVSARNIPNVITASVGTLNVFDILKYNTVVLDKAAVAKVEEVYA